MNHRITTIVLGVALALTGTLFVSSYLANVRLPGNDTGYEPVQPVAYSHRLHAGELGINCQFCHTGADKSRSAGVPSASVCMNCHRFITAPWVEVKGEDNTATKEKRKPREIISPEIRKIYRAIGLNDTRTTDVTIAQTPIKWIRVHRLPDFVYFNHSAHVTVGVDCQQCHGAVETMERVRQVSDLTMGWCVNCHRTANVAGVKGRKVAAPLDCIACHF
jgi:hypothetical protein